MPTPKVVAIDPLAVLLPSSVYQKLIEKFHPHVPEIELVNVVASLTREDKRAIQQKLKATQTCIAAVEKGLAAKAKAVGA